MNKILIALSFTFLSSLALANDNLPMPGFPKNATVLTFCGKNISHLKGAPKRVCVAEKNIEGQNRFSIVEFWGAKKYVKYPVKKMEWMSEREETGIQRAKFILEDVKTKETSRVIAHYGIDPTEEEWIPEYIFLTGVDPAGWTILVTALEMTYTVLR